MMESNSLPNQNKKMMTIVVSIALTLMAPLLMEQFTEGEGWGPFDFAVVGALLLAAVVIFQVATKVVRDSKHRIAIGAVLGLALLLVWIELAVGLIATPAAGS